MEWGRGVARGGVVGWGTMLQAGRSRIRFRMKSLDFSIDLILQAALCPWSRPSGRRERLDNLTAIYEPIV
jgi:hypothetical protein